MESVMIGLMPGPGMAHNGVVMCHNLRPLANNRPLLLSPAPLPAVVGRDGWRVLTVVSTGDRSVTLYARDKALALISRGAVIAQADLSGEPIAATPTVDGRGLVMTADGAYIVEATATTLAARRVAQPALPRLRAVAVGKVSATVDAIKLSKSYVSGEALLSDDSSRVSKVVNGAWDALDANARAAGLWWQPIVAMARLLSADGHEIMTTPPVLLRLGSEFCDTLEFQSDDSRITKPLTLTAEAWQIAVDMPQASLMPGVSVVEVVVSPMLHYADNSQACAVALRQRADDDYFMTAAYSPSGLGLRSGGREGSCQLAADVVARMGKLGQVVATARPVEKATTITVAAAPAASAKADRSALTAAIAVAPAMADSAETWLSAPHQISATTLCSMAGIVAMSGISVTPFCGYAAEDFAAQTEDVAWHAAVQVTMADGSTRVAVSEGTSGAPVAFSPVLSYPSAEAVGLRIITKVSGRGVVSGEFALRPDASGRRAVFVDEGLVPFELATVEAAYVVPEEQPAAVALNDYVAVAPAGAPLSPTAYTRLTGCDVVALRAAVSASQNLDFGRMRLFAFGSSGIHALTVKSGGCELASNLVDTRAVGSGAGVVYANNSILAAAGGDIVEISRSASSTLLRNVSGEALAWDAQRAELWVVSKGSVRVYCTQHNMGSYTLGLDADVDMASSVAGATYVGDMAGRLYRVGEDGNALSIDCRWQRYAEIKRRGRWVVALDAVGEIEKLTLSAARSHLNKVAPGACWSTTATAPDGASGAVAVVKSPLRRVVVMPVAGEYQLTIEATAGRSLVLRGLTAQPVEARR